MAFFLAIFLFILGFAVHLVIWRVKQPQATGQTLITTLVASIVGGAIVLWAGARIAPGLQAWLPASLSEWLQAIVAGLTMAALYVMTYPALEVESPTLLMIDILARAEPVGLTKDELYRRLSDDVLVIPRIEDLLREDLATETGGRCRLTKRGRRLEQVFSVWRRILGAGIGG
jgi:hypothetical protein